ncbi:MAG: zinc-finger domain-containing protein [Betaproteobacteria bacterium]|nr:zinc-finger domain-containing protein [Betaproteobacteria bacterium]
MRTDQAAPDHKPGSTVAGEQSSLVVELSAGDLPAHCPNARMPLWSSHPRIFLDVVNQREAMCPYCGTRYRLGASVDLFGFDTRGLHQHHRQHFLEPDAEHAESAAPTAGHRADANAWADASGNTTPELMTRWLKGRNWR